MQQEASWSLAYPRHAENLNIKSVSLR